MEWVTFLAKRIVALVVTMMVLVAVAYLVMYASPGGPLSTHQPPLYQQVFTSVWRTLLLHFGSSGNLPSSSILHAVKKALPISLILTFGSVTVAVLLGVTLGALAAMHRNTWIDSALTTVSLAGQAVPSYVIGVVFVLAFGVWIPGVLPITGWGHVNEAILPIAALSVGNVGIITRYMRSSMIEVLREDYVRTAEAKGMGRYAVVYHHGLRNAMAAVVTVMAPTFALAVVNTIWVEQVFDIPGMGTLLAQAFPTRDIPLSVTAVYVLGLLVMVANIIVDSLYRVFDPRVRL